MVEDQNILNVINKVFIPCRIVIEMEVLVSSFLSIQNYENIREIPKTQPSSETLIDVFKVAGIRPLESVIDFFINSTLNKLKPVVTYARDFHGKTRMGNVIPYTKGRVCLFFALHRLKIKYLIVDHFVENFSKEINELSKDDKNQGSLQLVFMETLNLYYLEKNQIMLKLMLHKKKVSERVNKLLDNNNSITTEKVLELATPGFDFDKSNIIKYIMREIKASLFVSKLMFSKIDISTPFLYEKDTQMNIEKIMISNDFIPDLLNGMSKAYDDKDPRKFSEIYKAFKFLMERVLVGINYAIKIASGNQIDLELHETIYDSGDIFE
jgi:hypothetical protein